MMQEYLKTAVIFVDRRFLFIGGVYAAFVVAVTVVAAVFVGKGTLAFIDHLFSVRGGNAKRSAYLGYERDHCAGERSGCGGVEHHKYRMVFVSR